MKKSVNKKIIICCICTIVTIALVVVTIDLINQSNNYNEAFRWGYCISNDDFNKSEKSFQNIAELVAKYSDLATNSKGVCIGVDYDKNSNNNYLTIISDGTKPQSISLTDREQEDLNIVDGQFKDKDAQLDTIFVYNDRISFNTQNGLYTLVYSPHDKKPTFINSPDDKTNFNVRKIKKCWYHVVMWN